MLAENKGPDFVDRIRQLATNGQTIDVAQFQFIGLEAVKAAYGDRWPAERERVSEVARAFVRKRVRDEDVLIPCESGFVVVFGALDSMDAAMTAHSIGNSLNSFFLGEDGGKFKVEVSHQSVSPADLGRFMSGVKAADMSSARRGEILPGAAADQSGFTLRFQPVWDAKHEAVTAWFTEALDSVSGDRIPGYRFENDVATRRPFVEIDDVSLRASEVVLKKLFASGRKAMLGVSIHVSSLVKLESRARILNTLAQLDAELLRYRIIRLSGVVPGFPRLYLKETVNALTMRAPHVVVGLSADEEDLSTALQCDPWGICWSAADGWSAEDPAWLARLRKSAAMARARQKRFFVEGDFMPAQARRIADSDVDFIASPLVWQPARAPGGVFKWEASRLDEENWVVESRC